jgi:16S rRNA (cytosine1402-N4)-methyltransferase
MKRSLRRSISRNEDSLAHIPVLSSQVARHLLVDPDGIYFDATVGTGGHAEVILSELGSRGMLVGIDKDKEAIEFAKHRLEKFKNKFRCAQLSFSEIPRFLDELGIKKVYGFLFDLGVCSLQLDKPERGFSYLGEGPLDMRMDQNQKISAYQVVNSYPLKDLIRIFKEYGEERLSSRVAKAILRKREKEKIKTTSQLRDITESVINPRHRIKSLSRIFQAIRMEVNREVDELEKGLDYAVKYLTSGGRLCFISYHSLEDRMVKARFYRLSRGCICPPDFPVCICNARAILRVVTKKPIRPSEDEIKDNPRAKSAKLRVAMKVG